MIQSEWLCLAGAALLHIIGVPVAYAVAPERVPVERVRRPSAKSEIDVDVEDAFSVKQESDRFRMDQAHGPAIGMRDASATHNPNFDPNLPPSMYNRGRINPNAQPGDAVLQAPTGTETDNDTFNADGSLGNAPGPGAPWGLPGTNPDVPYWALPGAPGIFTDGPDGPAAPTRTKPRKYDPDAATKAVADGVRAKDRKLGLDFPGRGPIRSAFVGATYGSDAPYDSSAVFGVSVDPKGNVTAVQYMSHTGGTAGTWTGVAKSAHAQLKSAKLVMKSAFKKGAVVSVIVTSKKKTPGGGTSRDGATINFDVADIGAKATRIVSASVVPSPIQ